MIDFRLNYPVFDFQTKQLQEAFASLSINMHHLVKSKMLAQDHIEAATAWLSTKHYPIKYDQIAITCGANSALTAIIIAAGLSGNSVLVDPLVYNGFRLLAATFNIKLIPCPIDQHGINPETLKEISLAAKPKAIYLNATIQNPLGIQMPLERRKDIIAIARQLNILIIDDDVYNFLVPDAPANFANLAPERSFFIQSFTKIIAPCVSAAFIISPVAYKTALLDAIRMTGGGVSPLFSQLVVDCIRDGTLNQLIVKKRNEAKHRQEIASLILNKSMYKSQETSFHIWLNLDKQIDSAQVAVKLRGEGVDTGSSLDYQVGKTIAINGLRLAIGNVPERTVLVKGLEIVANCLEKYQ